MWTPFGNMFRNKLRSLAQPKIWDALEDAVLELPKDVAERVKKTGRGKDDDFSPYSKDWAKTRRRAGLQTSKKDFWFSGKMWGGYKIQEKKTTDTGVSFVLGGTEGKASNGEYLVDVHSNREGQSIIEPTKGELESLQERINKAIGDYLNGVLGK
jgi:hypothetical protein